jgi:hypothetical protein
MEAPRGCWREEEEAQTWSLTSADDVSRATRFSQPRFTRPWRRLAGLHPPASTPGAFPLALRTQSRAKATHKAPPVVPHQNFASAHLHHRTAHSYEFSAPRWHDFSSVGDGECDGADAWFDCKKAADPPRCTTTGPPPHGAALTQLGAAENVGGGHNGRLQARAGAVAAGRGKAAFFAFQIFGALLLTPRHLRARSRPVQPRSDVSRRRR